MANGMPPLPERRPMIEALPWLADVFAEKFSGNRVGIAPVATQSGRSGT